MTHKYTRVRTHTNLACSPRQRYQECNRAEEKTVLLAQKGGQQTLHRQLHRLWVVCNHVPTVCGYLGHLLGYCLCLYASTHPPCAVAATRAFNLATVEGTYQNSTFCVVVPGGSASSRRLSTCILAGSIPVILANSFIPPFPFLNWRRFSLRLPESTAYYSATLEQALGALSKDTVMKMQHKLGEVQHLFRMPADGSNGKSIVSAILRSVGFVSDYCRRHGPTLR